jgi:CubicO group peptidase (beta-lactamase class C family)
LVAEGASAGVNDLDRSPSTMRSVEAMRRVVYVLALCCTMPLGATALRAQEKAAPTTSVQRPAVQERIAAVEKNLLPAVRIKGRSAPMALADRLRQLHVPGVSVAVINDGKIEWAKGYGVVEAGKETPVTADTLFQAASISKPVSALAALRLIDQGGLDLDRDVNEYLTSWKVPENEFTRQHAVDLRGILSHTAGLTVHGFDGYRVGAALPTIQQTLNGTPPANNKPVRVDKLPGKGFRYAGGGATIMQLLLTEVTAKTFTELMHESVLSPLGMASSTYEQPLPEAMRGRAASGHDEEGRVIAGRWHVYPERAAAGLWTTPTDLARYAIEVQQAHAGKSQKILSKKMADQMLTPQGEGPVGLGPMLEGAGATRRFRHGGANAGYRCELVAYVGRGQGAVVMTNADSGGRLAREVLAGIATVYAWPDYLSEERTIALLEPAMLDRFVGRYALGPIGTVTIERRENRLFARPSLGQEMEVFPESDTSFFTDEPGVEGKLVLDEKGAVREVVVRLPGQELRAKKIM